MVKKLEARQHKLYAGLASVAALALFTACTAEEPAQDEQPADQQTEQEETAAPADEETTNTGDDDADDDNDDDDDDDADDDSAASGDDDVYAVIDAVEAEYSNGFIVDIDLENGSEYEVDVVADNQVYELDVTADGNISVDDTEDDDDDIREAEQATVTVTEALDEAFSQYADATFDQIQLDEDDGALYWEIDLDDANGSEIELELPAT